jgi:two-component system phosphate regulon sensor histidine kinase PhoR
MSSKTPVLIILITALSLVGIVITQVFWVKSAFDQKEELFKNRVQIALKTISNSLINIYADSTVNHDIFYPHSRVSKSIIDPLILDSLFRDEFGCMHIRKDFVYGIYLKESENFLMGKYGKFQKNLLSSQNRVNLSFITGPESCILSVYFPQLSSIIFNQIILWIILSAFLIIVLIISFLLIIRFLLRQKKLSEMKSDFVNNMTHEFKTPIATISLASEMLMKPTIYSSSQRILKYANVIYDENTRLKNQVEQVLHIALLDKRTFRLKLREFNAHKIIASCIENYKLIIRERNGNINCQLDANQKYIYADKVHFANILSNLLDNANKYSPEVPQILVTTKNSNSGLVINVIDQGIGISPENQKLVFKKLFRVPTGNIHNVKGFGLGLFYVKKIVEAHGGYVNVKSEINQGSNFEIFFPFNKNNERITDNEEIG